MTLATLASIIAIAFALAADAFAVSVACSVRLQPLQRRQIFRFAFHFGLFQALMPTIGYLAGRTVEHWVAAWDHWLAFGLLGAIGFKAIVDGVRGEREDAAEAPTSDPTRGWSLIALSVATSIDALVVGVSLAWLSYPLWTSVLLIGLITGGLTTLGMLLGARLGQRFGRITGIIGGLVLIAIGARILLSHLYPS